MAWEGKFIRYTSAARYGIPEQAFDTVGFAINRRINPSLYTTGLALSAVDGRAGGFSMGLVGLGKLGLGRVHAFKGALDSPVGDLSINFPFSVPAKP